MIRTTPGLGCRRLRRIVAACNAAGVVQRVWRAQQRGFNIE